MGHIGPDNFEEITEGLNLDPMDSGFDHEGEGLKQIVSDRTMSAVAMAVHYDVMQKAFSDLKLMQQELTDLHE